MKVLWITNIPSPYRVEFFKELGLKCQLDVVFECMFSKERDKSWRKTNVDGFNAFFLKGVQYKTDMAFCPGIIKFLKKDYDVIVVTDYASLTGMFAIFYMKHHNISFVLEGDGAYRGSGQGCKEKLKRKLITSAKYWLATSEEHKSFYKFYGAKENKIFKYPFTSIREKEVLKIPPIMEQKMDLRQEKNIVEEYIVLSIGQFIYRKGYDVLLNAANKLDKNIGIYIIGGKPTEEYKEQVKQYNLTNVHFLDFMSPEELRYYYQLADLFVLPTREDIWGLVINEALANALPVITTNACIAGSELITTECGKIVEKDNADQLAFSIEESLYSTEWRRSAELACLKKIGYYTIENMCTVHMNIFDKILRGESSDM